MGPILVIDKSVLESLSRKDSVLFYRHFIVNITPILVVEIMADLKGSRPKIEPERRVKILADNAHMLHSFPNRHYHTLVEQDLLGNRVPMTGQVIPSQDGHIVDHPTRGKGVFYDESPEDKALRDWGRGDFEEGQKILATRWQEMKRKLNLKEFQAGVRRAFQVPLGLRNVEELKTLVDARLNHPNYQQFHLKTLLHHFRISARYHKYIQERFRSLGEVLLKDFAPYAFHCYRSYMLFSFALAGGLIDTKWSNRIDLEYLYYLPFCVSFTSRDKLHKKLGPLVLRDDQLFIDGDDLKRDLTRIHEHWNSLPEEERKSEQARLRSHPPELKGSVISKLWQEYCVPWSPAEPTDPEEDKKTLDELQEMIRFAEAQMGRNNAD